MKLTILNETGDSVVADRKVTTKHDRVKIMSTEEVQEEFDSLMANGYTAVNDKTKELVKGKITDTDELTMLYPIIGG
jgi:hypothetical protein